MSKRVRLAIIGTGGIFYGWGGGSGYLPNLPWMVGEAKVVALCDISDRSVKYAKTSLQGLFQEKSKEAEGIGDTERTELLKNDAEEVKTYTDLGAMLSTESPDLVAVCTPPSIHKQACIESLKVGANVMCEKPMAKTWLDAIEIVEAVKEAGKLFQYNSNMVFGDPWYQARKMIEAGSIGEPLLMFVTLTIGEPGSYRYTTDGVGALLDMGIHGITTSWFLAGFDLRPVRVRSVNPYGIGIRIKNRMDDGIQLRMPVEDDAHFLVEFEDKVTGRLTGVHIEGSWSERHSRGFIILGTDGSIEYERGNVKVTDVFGNSSLFEPFHGSWLNRPNPPSYEGYAQEIRNMCHCVLQGNRPMCDENIGAESMAVAGAAFLSERRGRKAITLHEFKEFALDLKKKEGKDASSALMRELRIEK